MELDELRRTQEWGALTTGEQKYVASFLENRNTTQAAKDGFIVKDEASAVAYGRQVIARKKVKDVIELFDRGEVTSKPMREPTQEEFTLEVWREVQRPGLEPGEKLRGLTLYAKLRGWDRVKKVEVEEDETFNDIKFS